MHAVNLLPSEQRAPVTPSGGGGTDAPVGALAILAVLLVAIVAVALHVQGTNTVKDREAELAGVNAQLAAVQSQTAQLQRYEAFQTLAVTRRQTVSALAAGRFDWARSLRDIARVLPSDAYLSGLCADGGAGGCDAGLRSALPNATAIGVTGCTSSQDAVANLMTRLRDVRGVTRVTLDSSVSADNGDTASVTCPAGTPPQFDLIVFFERSPISAAGQANAATGATAAATPAATPAAGATPTPTASAAPGTTATPTPSATP